MRHHRRRDESTCGNRSRCAAQRLRSTSVRQFAFRRQVSSSRAIAASIACCRAPVSSVASSVCSRRPACARPSARITTGSISPWPTSVTTMTENVREQDQVAVRKRRAARRRQRDRQRRGERDDAAHAGEGEQRTAIATAAKGRACAAPETASAEDRSRDTSRQSAVTMTTALMMAARANSPVIEYRLDSAQPACAPAVR